MCGADGHRGKGEGTLMVAILWEVKSAILIATVETQEASITGDFDWLDVEVSTT